MSVFKYFVGFLSKECIMLLFSCINAVSQLFFCLCVRSNSAIFDQQQLRSNYYFQLIYICVAFCDIYSMDKKNQCQVLFAVAAKMFVHPLFQLH